MAVYVVPTHVGVGVFQLGEIVHDVVVVVVVVRPKNLFLQNLRTLIGGSSSSYDLNFPSKKTGGGKISSSKSRRRQKKLISHETVFDFTSFLVFLLGGDIMTTFHKCLKLGGSNPIPWHSIMFVTSETGWILYRALVNCSTT